MKYLILALLVAGVVEYLLHRVAVNAKLKALELQAKDLLNHAGASARTIVTEVKNKL